MEINRGGRPKKIKVDISDDGLREILQKIVVEAEDVRQKSLLVFNKGVRKMKETNDIALIGKTTAEYLKIASNATTSKLAVAKIVQDHIKNREKLTSGDDNTVDGGFVISDDLKEQIANLHNDVSKGMEKLAQGEEMIDVNKALGEIEDKEIVKIKKDDTR